MQTEEPSLTAHQKEVLRAALVAEFRKLLGIPYSFAAEWNDYSTLPEFLDCSESVEGVFHIAGMKMPDGAQAQFNFTIPSVEPLPGDLAFFGKGGDIGKVYHVGMIFDQDNVIEARGFDPKASFETGKVILRARQKWEIYSNFCGYRSHPKLV